MDSLFGNVQITIKFYLKLKFYDKNINYKLLWSKSQDLSCHKSPYFDLN